MAANAVNASGIKAKQIEVKAADSAERGYFMGFPQKVFFQQGAASPRPHARKSITRLVNGILEPFPFRLKSERRLYFFVLTRFLHANRHPLRWKTLYLSRMSGQLCAVEGSGEPEGETHVPQHQDAVQFRAARDGG